MSIRKLGPYLRPYARYCVAGPFFKLVEAVLDLYLPLLMAQVIDRGLLTGDKGYVLRMGGVMLAIVALGLGSALICQYVASITSQGFGTRLRDALFTHILRLSHADLDRFGTPSLINRVTSDVNQLQYAVAMLIRLVIRAPFLCIGGVIMTMTIDLPLSLVILAAIPLFVLVIALVMRVTVPLHRAVQHKLDTLARLVRENLSGVRVIRAFARTDTERARFDKATDDHTRTAIRVGRIAALLNPATQLLMSLAILAILWFGGWRSFHGLTTGQIIAFINYVNQILLALIVVSNLVVTFTRAYASAGRVLEVLDTVPSVEDPTADAVAEAVPQAEHSATAADSATRAAADVPAVEFRQVRFAYGGEDVLHDIDFIIPRGATVGIIGGTGAGKSTLLQLMLRFYDVTGGSVRINGRDVRDYPTQELRRQIALVPQKVELFEGSVEENLRWGDDAADETRLREAVTAAQATEFVSRLPDGLHAPVERGGTNFSGGQRQRLAIARALVRQADILLLDDASSALDYATDAALRRALRQEQRSRAQSGDPQTVLLVSQRVSTVEHANPILVLDDGCLAGIGTHEELLRTCAEYQEICRSQRGDPVRAAGEGVSQ